MSNLKTRKSIVLKHDSSYLAMLGVFIFFVMAIPGAAVWGPVLYHLDKDAVSISIFIMAILATWFFCFALFMPGFRLRLQNDQLFIRKRKWTSEKAYPLQEVEQLLFSNKAVQRSGYRYSSPRKEIISTFTLVFKGGGQLEIPEDGMENFLLMRESLMNRLEDLGILDFSWRRKIREEEKIRQQRRKFRKR